MTYFGTIYTKGKCLKKLLEIEVELGYEVVD
jgi:hypothetical protein